MDDFEEVFKQHTAGSSIDAWNTTYLPPEEWANEIFEDAQRMGTLLPTIKRRYDSPRKVTVPVKTLTSSDWSSTVAQNVRSFGSSTYDATGIALDPVEYRTYMPMARKSFDEATWALERDVRNRLANATALKLDQLIWQTLDGTAISSYAFQTAGESLTNTTTGNAVDYGTSLSVDNVVDCIYNVRNTSYNMYKPDTAVISPAMMKGLVKESPMLSAAEFGNPEVVRTGTFSNALGLTFRVTYPVQDSGSTDVGIVYDSNYYFIGNVSQEFELASARRYETDEIEFFAKLKAAFSVGDSEAGAVLYS